jgi:hypothetical protein
LLCTNSLPDRLSDATREAHFAVGPALVRVVVARAIAPVFFEQPANHTEALVRLHRVALVALDKIQYVVLTISGVIEQLAEAIGFGHLGAHFRGQRKASN